MPAGPNDSATIAAGKTCNLDVAATVGALTVSGTATLNINHNLTVTSTNPALAGIFSVTAGGTATVADEPAPATLTANLVTVSGKLTDDAAIKTTASNIIGPGTVSIGSGGVFNLGSTDDLQGDATVTTNSFFNAGTTTVGSPTGGGTATLDATSASMGSGSFALGMPGAGGGAGEMTVTGALTIAASATVIVGGANGSGGSLDAKNIPSAGTVTVNDNGEISVLDTATFGGLTTVTGEIKAENGGAFQGAGVLLSGTGSVGGSNGKLVAEINSAFIFGPSSAWAILPGNPPGGALNEGQFYVDGPLTVSTALNPDGDITLNNDGSTTAGTLTGSGSLDEHRSFTWTGGTLGLAGGATIEADSDWQLSGANAKVLTGDLTNISLTTDFGGAGMLTIGSGATFTNAVGTVAVSLPLITGGGTFSNVAKATVQFNSPAPSGTTIAAILDNEGILDCETATGPLTFSDTSGKSVLDGSLNLNNDSLTISGDYTTENSFAEDYSGSDLTTLTGALTLASGASADFDHLVLDLASGASSGGTVGGAGELSIGADGLHTGDFLKWINGSMSGGSLSIGPNATLYLMGTGTLSRNLDNAGTVEWTGGVVFGNGVEVHNFKGGLFDFEGGGDGYVPTFTNDGTLELGSGTRTPLTVDTFTQSSTGVLQSDIASATGYGSLKVTGAATLDGTLQANLQNGYQPPSGTSFDVLDFGSSSGQFADVEPQGWTAQYNPTSVDLISS